MCILTFSLLVLHFVVYTYLYEVQQGQKLEGWTLELLCGNLSQFSIFGHPNGSQLLHIQYEY